jgi:hypothetical protein
VKKLTAYQAQILRIIRDEHGGSYCPADGFDPMHYRALDELAKSKRLTVEVNDGAPPRYHLTERGRADAS